MDQFYGDQIFLIALFNFSPSQTPQRHTGCEVCSAARRSHTAAAQRQPQPLDSDKTSHRPARRSARRSAAGGASVQERPACSSRSRRSLPPHAAGRSCEHRIDRPSVPGRFGR